MSQDLYTLRKAIEAVDTALDAGVSHHYQQQPLAQDWARVSKVLEEAGEAMNALIGFTGQNPRKRFYASKDELIMELADVALTGLYAIQHFTKSSTVTLDTLVARAVVHRERLSKSSRTWPTDHDSGSVAE